MGSFTKPVLFCAFLGAVLAASHGTAHALSEFCPARVDGFHRVGNASSTYYAFTVSAEGSRTVSGDIVVKADKNWYRIAFPNTTLIGRIDHWKDPYAEFTRSEFSSPVLYARFPEPVTTIDAYVADAKTIGEKSFDWDSQGDVTCSPPAGFSLHDASGKGVAKDAPVLMNPRTDLDPSEVLGGVLTAAIIPIPGSTDCEHPFTDATVLHAVPPEYPVEVPLTNTTVVEVKVLVDANGQLADTWLYAPSGYKDYDDATLVAARKSMYRAGAAFCKPAPGEYLFLARYSPR